MPSRLAWIPVLILLTACAAAAPTAAPSPAPPTAALDPTATPADTPTPTDTATVTAVPSPTLLPTPTATPVVLNPLTGLPVADPAVLDRRPLAIKIAHFPRGIRPQSGLSFADNVWEHYAEGGVTRFTAIFFSQGPEKVGNVRSARLIDTILGEAYHAMLVASGSSQGTLDRLRETDFYDRVIAEATGYSGCPILCREEAKTVTTDKLFTSPAALWQLAESLGLGGGQALGGFVFDPQTPPGGEPASTIHLDFQLNNTVVEWQYDPASQTYARWVDTNELPALAPHTDALTGQQLSAASVVVLYVTHVPSNIREDEAGQFFSYEIQLNGSGPARLFRDGRLYEASWARAERGLPRLVDAGGRAVPLRPGVTWFEVVTPDSPTRFAEGAFSLRFKAPNPFPEATATP